MPVQGFTLFDTAIGRCGVAWSERGVAGVQLPERNEAATRARLLRRHGEAREATPPPEIARAIDGIVALIGGERCDLSDIAIDLADVPEFNRRVYAIARTIAPGTTLTYGAIAARLGEPDARAVGEAMGRNPIPVIVPCHRVVAAGGRTGGYKTGGFSAPGGVATKLRLLAIEGARLDDEPTLFDRDGGLAYDVRKGARARRGAKARRG
jgi:methylated-DNA-[protein]-cysteine S-methyltransferase